MILGAAADARDVANGGAPGDAVVAGLASASDAGTACAEEFNCEDSHADREGWSQQEQQVQKDTDNANSSQFASTKIQSQYIKQAPTASSARDITSEEQSELNTQFLCEGTDSD